MFGGDDRSRGQAHTLEGVVAAMLLLTSLVFALQSTAVTPLSASTSSQHIENQEESMADGVLSIAASQEILLDTVVYWNESTERFHASGGRGYSNDADFPDGFAMGDLFESSFSTRGIAYNVDVVYQDEEGEPLERRLVHRGVPSDNAVTVSRVLTVYDETALLEKDGSTDTLTVDDSLANFYMPDASPDSPVYNTVRIEITVWRM